MHMECTVITLWVIMMCMHVSIVTHCVCRYAQPTKTCVDLGSMVGGRHLGMSMTYWSWSMDMTYQVDHTSDDPYHPHVYPVITMVMHVEYMGDKGTLL